VNPFLHRKAGKVPLREEVKAFRNGSDDRNAFNGLNGRCQRSDPQARFQFVECGGGPARSHFHTTIRQIAHGSGQAEARGHAASPPSKTHTLYAACYEEASCQFELVRDHGSGMFFKSVGRASRN
jgi:hypothetical protein